MSSKKPKPQNGNPPRGDVAPAADARGKAAAHHATLARCDPASPGTNGGSTVSAASTAPQPGQRLRGAKLFYRDALRNLQASAIPFLVGGAYALERYTTIFRDTKDFDIFVRPRDVETALAVLAEAGYKTEVTATHWLAKAYSGKHFVDIIFSSGNGLCDVDDAWLENAEPAEVFGLSVLLAPAEEMIWQKAYIMERDRFDGADVIHLMHARAEQLDWTRLLARFDSHWRVLFAHLLLYGFVYPGERDRIPQSILAELVERLDAEGRAPALDDRICQGTLLSVKQYLVDVECWDLEDVRLMPIGHMTSKQVAQWNVHLETEHKQAPEP